MLRTLQEPERIPDLPQREGSIDHGFDSRCLDPPYHVDLVLTAADDQPLKPLLPQHQNDSGNDPAHPGQNADHRNMPADPARQNGLG